MLECGAPGLELGLLRFGNRAHFRIGRRIGNQARHALQLMLGGAIGFHRFHDRRQLGEFARELDVSLRRNRRGEFAFEHGMTGDERVEFLIGQHGLGVEVSGVSPKYRPYLNLRGHLSRCSHVK